jgi:hypothetical protein
VSRVVLVHGIAQQYKGPESLHAECAPALRDGLRFAGGAVDPRDISVAFYGDLFRPPGARSPGMPDYDASDVNDPFERELLHAWWLETAEREPSVPGPTTATRARSPQWVQRAIYALSGSRYFGNLTERALIGSLKQVRQYLTEKDTRRRVHARLLDTITPDTAVVIGHSLGSVVAYEVLNAESCPPVDMLVTLGSPLGLPRLIFDRLEPAPNGGRGHWPQRIRQWTNIADTGDVVANPKTLAPLFGADVLDVAVHNGAKAHDIRPYLTASETGLAVLTGLGRQPRGDT